MTARDRELDSVEHNLTIFLRRARRLSADAASAVHPDLEPQAYGLLVRIDELGSVRASDLAGYFGVGKPTMSRQLTALETLGFVERKPNEADARSYLVTLSDSGSKRIREVRQGRKSRFREALSSWSEAEIDQLAGSLQRLNDTEF